ncbi:hypothetical protein FXO37_34049 [Capsicum annuum]|nr:hypothetical protein FXO37_34049 [Capsicum annuum]
MELFGATNSRRKIILEGGLVAVDDGSGSGAAVGDNDAPLIFFETTSHYDYVILKHLYMRPSLSDGMFHESMELSGFLTEIDHCTTQSWLLKIDTETATVGSSHLTDMPRPTTGGVQPITPTGRASIPYHSSGVHRLLLTTLASLSDGRNHHPLQANPLLISVPVHYIISGINAKIGHKIDNEIAIVGSCHLTDMPRPTTGGVQPVTSAGRASISCHSAKTGMLCLGVTVEVTIRQKSDDPPYRPSLTVQEWDILFRSDGSLDDFLLCWIRSKAQTRRELYGVLKGAIPSKRISYPYTPLEIKVAKRRRKDILKASSSIEKRKIAMPLSLSYIVVQCARAIGEQHKLKKEDVIVKATTEEHNIIVDNPSNVSKEEEKIEPTKWIADGLLKHHAGRDCGLFVAAYAEYLSDGLQVPNDGLDVRLLRKRYASLLQKYGEAKAQKSYGSDIKDPR